MVGLICAYVFIFDWWDVRLIVYFPAFFLGLYAGNIESSGVDIKKFFNIKVISFISLISILLFLLFYGHARDISLLSSMPMIMTVPLLLIILLKDISLKSSKIVKSVLFLSFSSYCMYLFHRPVYSVLTFIYFPESQILQLYYLVFVCLPCIILLSFFIQYFYDNMLKSLKW